MNYVIFDVFSLNSMGDIQVEIRVVKLVRNTVLKVKI